MSAPFDFDFRSVTPEGDLARWVESVWYARGTVPYRRERIAPTGSTVAVIVLGDPIIEIADDGAGETVETDRGFVIGPHDRPVVNEPTGETFAVGVVCTPVGAGLALGVRPSRLRGRVVELPEAWPAGVELRDQLHGLSPDEMLEVTLEHLNRTRSTPSPHAVIAEEALEILSDDPTCPIAEVAREVGVSHGHLVRVYNDVVGITPRTHSRMLRMRQLLSELDVHGEIGWSERAAALGWYDQAHLIRDFRRHTGVTPTEYISAQRATFSPVESVDAAGFVPEG